MAGPVFPDVPKVPGVPAVARSLVNPGTATEPQLTQDSITVTATAKNEWGVYTASGALALEPDSISAIGYDAEYRVADFPIEEGGFETYDKVALPFQNRVVMTKGGTLEQRRTFLRAVEELRGDLELYNVVTPEWTYLNVNIVRTSLDRSRENGSGLITVELQLQEIRQNATASFTQTRDPASASPVSNGSVQPQPSPATTSGVQ
mgnify:CR=1 FL=1|nr:MAG TPA_asm: hypothetical protein [Caudoviricetes sp.]